MVLVTLKKYICQSRECHDFRSYAPGTGNKDQHIITPGTHIPCDMWALEPYAPNDRKECGLWSRTVNFPLAYRQLFFTYIGLLAQLVPKATYGNGGIGSSC